MTLEQYYDEVVGLKAPTTLKTPEGISFWYSQQYINLKNQLSNDDLKKLHVNEQYWQECQAKTILIFK